MRLKQQLSWIECSIERWLMIYNGRSWIILIWGAMCHTCNETIYLLLEEFSVRVICRRGHLKHPSRPCGSLTPCNLFVWGHMKNKVFASSPASFKNLNEWCRKAIEDIGPFVMKNLVMKNFMKLTYRCDCCGHLADVTCHY